MSRPRSVVTVLANVPAAHAHILSEPALEFLAMLHRQFHERRHGLLALRDQRQKRLDAGEMPTFLPHTAHVRDGSWKCASPPADLEDRRVEITGPVDRKMVINALNSGANVFMADFEDSSSPTFFNMLDGQVNLYDAVRRTIEFTKPARGSAKAKVYRLPEDESKIATLMVRPRGWHLDEAHVLVDGEPMSGSLFDFGLYFFHNAHYLLERGSGPYFYLPKLESHREARLWHDVFVAAEAALAVPRGSVRCTVLLETILAAFEMEEIIFELREYGCSLNCGRWDYIFSFLRVFRKNRNMVLPDRDQVGMNKPFMSNYVNLVVKTCHKRGAHAMGGMAAQIPIKNDRKANQAAIDKVRKDKLREVKAGHDGTWVAHPALIPVAKEVFDEHMPTPNQVHQVARDDVSVSAADLVDIGSPGRITTAGLVTNIAVGLEYVAAWLCGNGCIPVNHKMEDAATAEISRTQVWQWIQHAAKTEDGQPITKERVSALLRQELQRVKDKLGFRKFEQDRWELAGRLYGELLTSDTLERFLTTKAYPYIISTSDSLSLKSSM